MKLIYSDRNRRKCPPVRFVFWVMLDPRAPSQSSAVREWEELLMDALPALAILGFLMSVPNGVESINANP